MSGMTRMTGMTEITGMTSITVIIDITDKTRKKEKMIKSYIFY